MTVWTDRSPIAAAMLNPALVAAVLATAARGHYRETERGMPWSLSFIVTPMVLHRSTREALPRSTRTHLASWAGQHPVVRAGFPDRAAALVEHVREGVRFGLSYGALAFDEEARLQSAYTRPRGFQTPEELDVLLRKANLAGRWLSKADPATVFAVLGVAP